MTNTQTKRKDNWEGLNQIIAECTTLLIDHPSASGVSYDGKTGELKLLADYSDLFNLGAKYKN